jgi:hypothetical protein
LNAARPLELPPDVAKAFVKDMARYFIEPDPMKRDEIASFTCSRNIRGRKTKS